MKKIFKFPLQVAECQAIPIPATAQIISVGYQEDILMCWVLLDPSHAVKFGRYIFIYGTGISIHVDSLQFIGTVQNAGFVWHIFDGGEA